VRRETDPENNEGWPARIEARRSVSATEMAITLTRETAGIRRKGAMGVGGPM
jgi:hypothetical protein